MELWNGVTIVSGVGSSVEVWTDASGSFGCSALDSVSLATQAPDKEKHSRQGHSVEGTSSNHSCSGNMGEPVCTAITQEQ